MNWNKNASLRSKVCWKLRNVVANGVDGEWSAVGRQLTCRCNNQHLISLEAVWLRIPDHESGRNEESGFRKYLLDFAVVRNTNCSAKGDLQLVAVAVFDMEHLIRARSSD
jgi:hypothetical protein